MQADPRTQAIPEDKIWEFRECFNWFDRDNDEKIQGADLPTAVRAMGQYWTFGEVRQLAIEYPPSRDITFQEFLKVCTRKWGVAPDNSALDRAFDVFDRNRAGRVAIDDVKHVITTVGEKLTPSEFEELCRINGIVYKGGNQTIDKKQFLTLFGVPSNP